MDSDARSFLDIVLVVTVVLINAKLCCDLSNGEFPALIFVEDVKDLLAKLVGCKFFGHRVSFSQKRTRPMNPIQVSARKMQTKIWEYLSPVSTAKTMSVLQKAAVVRHSHTFAAMRRGLVMAILLAAD